MRCNQLTDRFCGAQLVLLAAMVLLLAGCASQQWATPRKVPKNSLTERFDLTPDGPIKPSNRTVQLLRVYDMEDDLKGDPHELLKKLQALHEREPSSETLYAVAELSYLVARRIESSRSEEALDLYGASALTAYQYLFDSRFHNQSNPFDPRFRGACDLYNGALEAGLRIVCKQKTFKPGEIRTINTPGGTWDISVVVRGGQWKNEDFDHFEFVSDYEVPGLRNHYRSYGLGVPLIAVRRNYENEPEAAKYYPDGLTFPVTVFMRPASGCNVNRATGEVHYQAALEIYDPLTVSRIAINDRYVPIESDLSTPLAVYLSNSKLDQLATVSLLKPELVLKKLRPGREDSIMGLYMMQPYEPDKIPVLFVHGLWSTPGTWTQMYNDLRNSPEIRKNYQFWFYIYPTGRPYWFAAAQLRKDLNEARDILDRHHKNPALDQMVLIGHSMGGLVSQLQTLDSRDDFWHMLSDRSFADLKAEPDARAKLREVLFFRPNPSIQRVITIGTPFRGSNFSRDTTQLLMSQLIKLPDKITGSQEQLLKDNKGLFRDTRVLKTTTSIDSLSPDSPMFSTMLAARRAPWVHYHNIIGLVPKKGLFGTLAAGTDGVVAKKSAHLDGIESEIDVEADHSTVHVHPKSVLEVRRILLEHITTLRTLSRKEPLTGNEVLRQASQPTTQR